MNITQPGTIVAQSETNVLLFAIASEHASFSLMALYPDPVNGYTGAAVVVVVVVGGTVVVVVVVVLLVLVVVVVVLLVLVVVVLLVLVVVVVVTIGKSM